MLQQKWVNQDKLQWKTSFKGRHFKETSGFRTHCHYLEISSWRILWKKTVIKTFPSLHVLQLESNGPKECEQVRTICQIIYPETLQTKSNMELVFWQNIRLWFFHWTVYWPLGSKTFERGEAVRKFESCKKLSENFLVRPGPGHAIVLFFFPRVIIFNSISSLTLIILTSRIR